MKVIVRADGIQPTGWVRARLATAGRWHAARLRGREAVLRIRVPENAQPGVRLLAVRYSGDEHVAGAQTTSEIRIVR